MSKQPGREENKRKVNLYVRYSGLGFQLIVMVALGAFGGVKLDERFPMGGFPVFTVGLTLFALVASMYFLYRASGNK